METEYQNRKVDPNYGGPEYETIGTFGSYCGVDDLNAISMANQICNQYGLDTIGTGATIAFAIECYQNGLISSADTDGIELGFGRADAMITLLEKIAKNEGFGKILAQGSARAAQAIGGNAQDFLITVKGAEAPAHMPQSKKSLGVIYAVNPFGADHQSSEHDPMYEEGAADWYIRNLGVLGLTNIQEPFSFNEEKVRFAYLTQVFYSALDSYNLCQFVWGPSWQLFGPPEMAVMLQAATGWDITVEEIMTVGERRLNMMRTFNTREGFTRADDLLPKKFAKALIGTGPTSGVSVDFEYLEKMKDYYYSLAGWDPVSGNPGREKLAKLGLEWIEI